MRWPRELNSIVAQMYIFAFGFLSMHIHKIHNCVQLSRIIFDLAAGDFWLQQKSDSHKPSIILQNKLIIKYINEIEDPILYRLTLNSLHLHKSFAYTYAFIWEQSNRIALLSHYANHITQSLYLMMTVTHSLWAIFLVIFVQSRANCCSKIVAARSVVTAEAHL